MRRRDRPGRHHGPWLGPEPASALFARTAGDAQGKGPGLLPLPFPCALRPVALPVPNAGLPRAAQSGALAGHVHHQSGVNRPGHEVIIEHRDILRRGNERSGAAIMWINLINAMECKKEAQKINKTGGLNISDCADLKRKDEKCSGPMIKKQKREDGLNITTMGI